MLFSSHARSGWKPDLSILEDEDYKELGLNRMQQRRVIRAVNDKTGQSAMEAAGYGVASSRSLRLTPQASVQPAPEAAKQTQERSSLWCAM